MIASEINFRNNALFYSAYRCLIYLADAKSEEKYPLQTGQNAKQKVC
jgi:hypothetical protein